MLRRQHKKAYLLVIQTIQSFLSRNKPTESIAKAIQVLAIQVPHRPQQIQVWNHYNLGALFNKEQLELLRPYVH